MLLQPPSWPFPATREAPSDYWLECVDLSLQSDGRLDLDGVTLRCRRGEWVVLLDAAGASARALLAIVEGRCRPHRGAVHWPRGARPALAVVLGHLRWPPAIRLVELLAALGLPRRLPLLETTGFARLPDRLLGNLSPYEARLVQLAIADVQPSDTLVLDDPLQGLDADARRHMAYLLTSLRTRWPQALVRTPDASPLIGLCDRRVRLDRGRICRDSMASAGPAAGSASRMGVGI